MRPSVLLVLALFVLEAAGSQVEHRLQVVLEPETSSLAVTDTITWPAPPQTDPVFELHAGLDPQALGDAKLARLGRRSGSVPYERYRLELARGQRRATLRYSGRLHHPLDEAGQGVGRRRQGTPGYIAGDGVYLSGASGWVPAFVPARPLTFDLAVRVPDAWHAVSQGAAVEGDDDTIRWRERRPQLEIHLVAGPYHVSRRPAGPVEARVYLREHDPELADRYLGATGDYLTLFSTLMGDYPYDKFALVANFWESGYGMPSFTLLGPRVLRLPFILDSAYPHEIVHNWWGNGVFVDYDEGNWSEGLTAYMADHLLAERRGGGAAYRRDQLQKYAEYVSGGRDFPLAEFTARHDGASQAIGYGKGLMLFHMLRLRLGDAMFLKGLRDLYQKHRFTRASFSDVRRAFEAAGAAPLADFFQAWVERAGAPRLELGDVDAGTDEVTLSLTQTGPGQPFPLRVPVAIRYSDGEVAEHRVSLSGDSTRAALPLSGEPRCLAVDPRFDLFRRLLPGEIPVSLDSLLGAEQLTLVTPSAAPAPMRRAYDRLAEAWAATWPHVTVRADDELESLPADRSIWLLGWENRFRSRLAGRLDAAADVTPGGVRLAGRTWSPRGRSFVVTAPGDDNPIAWLAADDPAAVPGLARKVPHYGKYSYLVFAGDAPDNLLKGQWPATASPLVHRLDGHRGACDVPPRSPLARRGARSHASGREG